VSPVSEEQNQGSGVVDPPAETPTSPGPSESNESQSTVVPMKAGASSAENSHTPPVGDSAPDSVVTKDGQASNVKQVAPSTNTTVAPSQTETPTVPPATDDEKAPASETTPPTDTPDATSTANGENEQPPSTEAGGSQQVSVEEPPVIEKPLPALPEADNITVQSDEQTAAPSTFNETSTPPSNEQEPAAENQESSADEQAPSQTEQVSDPAASSSENAEVNNVSSSSSNPPKETTTLPGDETVPPAPPAVTPTSPVGPSTSESQEPGGTSPSHAKSDVAQSAPVPQESETNGSSESTQDAPGTDQTPPVAPSTQPEQGVIRCL
jgi:hypothetical protein